MCGLTAMQGRAGAPSWDVGAAATAASRAQAHRGPDGEGLWLSAPDAETGSVTALAHRRLAILDPSPAGAQPMHDPSTGNVLVLNGEIYNHRALRTELGGAWHSGSDTETLLRAYAAWGEGCLERLRGMFAFALWDARRGVLVCARDRLGIKPLYVAEGAGGTAVASEVRALLSCGVVAAHLDLEALHGYLRFGCVQEPQTLLLGVRSLPAGHLLEIKGGQVVRQACWWSLRERLDVGGGGGALETLLEQAVVEHLESDVPVAWLLSGGIDAALLLALAAKGRGGQPQAFTLAWDDPALDESEVASEVARHVGARHAIVRLGEDDSIAEVQRAVGAFDQPTVDGINTWLVARAIRQAGLKVAISGLGGDELFGGYPSFRWVPQAERWSPVLGRLPGWSRRLALGRARAERAGDLWARGASPAERLAAVRSLWGRSTLSRAVPGRREPDSRHPKAPTSLLPIHVEVGVGELEGYMRSMLLRDTDALAMAQGVELRVPYLDTRVVLAALARSRAGDGSTLHEKQALRTLAADHLPPAVLARRKQGFVLPMQRWIEGPLSGFVRAGFDHVRERGWLAEPFLDEVEASLLRKRFAWSRPWAVAVLGHWAARNVPLNQAA